MFGIEIFKMQHVSLARPQTPPQTHEKPGFSVSD